MSLCSKTDGSTASIVAERITTMTVMSGVTCAGTRMASHIAVRPAKRNQCNEPA